MYTVSVSMHLCFVDVTVTIKGMIYYTIFGTSVNGNTSIYLVNGISGLGEVSLIHGFAAFIVLS